MTVRYVNQQGRTPSETDFDPKINGYEYRKVASVYAMEIDEPFIVETLEGVVLGNTGDYLCVGPGGEKWPIKREIFLATYVRAL